MKSFVTRNLDDQRFGERVDNGNADAVEAAGSFVGVAGEFSSRMQLGHDDFEGRDACLVLVDRDASAVVGHRQHAFGGQFDIDRRCVSCDIPKGKASPKPQAVIVKDATGALVGLILKPPMRL